MPSIKLAEEGNSDWVIKFIQKVTSDQDDTKLYECQLDTVAKIWKETNKDYFTIKEHEHVLYNVGNNNV